MKRAVFTLWLLLAAVAATAQSEPTPPEFEYSDLQRLTPEDYIDMQLPPLHVLMENARHAPQVGYYESNREIEERELKTVRRNWMRNFKLNANYNYGSSDIYNQNYQDSNIPIWTTTTTGREQSWWNVGASLSIPLDEIFNRRNKIKQQKKRIENTQYDLDRWYDELRMKIIDAYTTAVEQLSILRSAAEAKITSEAQYRMTEVDFVKGKLDAQTLSRQKSLENSATREYEQVRRNLNDALLRLEILTHTPIINKPISMPGVSKEAPYTARFLYRIKWWLILCPLLVALLVYLKMGTKPRNYKSTTTIYTGIVSGYDITTTEGSRQDWNVINNAMDNLINIILSQSTLKNVSLRLYAQGLTHLDPDNDNQYLSARTSRYLLSKTPPDVMELVDHTSEKNTYENLRKYEEIDHNNHVYGMFHWSPPYYSYQALSQIKVKRLANSDMLEISYENDDPYIVYNTLIILNDEFVKQYRDLRFGETNNVIAYFESELERVGNNLRNLEDSLRDYNVQHRVINYDEQTKHSAALSRDYELRSEEILLNFESAE